MMTIKQMSTVSGVSARTLRYYEEIGLFSPTEKSETGYRLYDDEALEVLRQILYFREMGIPLKTIKEILSDPALDKNHILKMQKRMLEAERKRIDKLIASIDEALKGADVDFTVFTREESTELFEAMLAHMPDEMRETAVKEFGSIDNWREHYLDAVGKGKVQRQYEKIIEWYGGKDAYLGAVKKPLNQEIRDDYQSQIESILEKLYHKRNMDVDCFEVRELIGEYGFTLKQLLQLKQEREMMLSQARIYKDEQVQASTDAKYGTVDICVNGGAIFYPKNIEVDGNDWFDITESGLHEVLDNNLMAVMHSYQTVLRYMVDNKIQGCFLNFSSSTALS